jgi:intergrase/recombinase
MCFNYTSKYVELLDNPSMIETFSRCKRNNVLKALIALSKYLGFYREFKEKLSDYGIKWHRTSSIDSFLRILNNQNKDVLVWSKKATNILNAECGTYLRFLLLSGLRPSEAIESFNLIRTKLNAYYNEELCTLEHFRFKEIFLRNTKNAFITIIPKSFVMEIAPKEKVTYSMIKLKLQRNQLPMRLNELRDYYGTFMVRHGLIKEEVDLLQGRIGKSVFVRHYWSPAIKELKQRVFKALKELELNVLS